MKYVFDIDGTICNSFNDYKLSSPIMSRISQINKLYDEGNVIVYHTARGMGRLKDNSDAADIMFRGLTESQLFEWGCKYHELILGKPSADVYVDDKAIKDTDFFGES